MSILEHHKGQKDDDDDDNNNNNNNKNNNNGLLPDNKKQCCKSTLMIVIKNTMRVCLCVCERVCERERHGGQQLLVLYYNYRRTASCVDSWCYDLCRLDANK